MFEGAVDRARAEARAHGRQGAAALGAFLLGAALLLFGSQSRWLWTRGALAAFGLVFVAASLMWFHDRLLRLVDTLDRRERRVLWFVFPGLLAASAAVFGVAIWNGWLALGVVAIALAAVGAMGTHIVLRIDADGGTPGDVPPDERPPPHPLRSLWLPVEMVVAGIGTVWALDRFTLIGWVGLGAALVGSILLKQQMASLVHNQRLDWRITAHASADVSIVGVLLVWRGAATGSQLAVLAGAALAFCGLSVFGIALLYWRRRTRWWVGFTLVAAAAIVAGWAWTGHVLGVYGWAALLVAFVGVVGAWFVFRGEGIIAVVMVGALGLWGLAPGYSNAAPDPTPDGEVRMLVLGDSFISGEGARTYLEGTNQVGGDDRNECRRAPTAYAYRIAADHNYGLDFVACSGATTEDLLSCGQMATGALRCRPSEAWSASPPDGDDAVEVVGTRPQLYALTDAQLADVDVVLVSIGGNDVGFATIVQACLLPRSCAERAQQWLANVDEVGPKLTATYSAIRERVGPEVPVVVVPYPMLVDGDAPCGKGLDDGEYTFIADFTRHLDRQIKASADAAGVVVWEAGIDAYAGHRICNSDPGVNHLSLDPPNGAPIVRSLPSTWVHNSMHPNPRGHEIVAARLAPFLADVLSGKVPMPPPPDAPADDAGPGSEPEVPAEPYVDLSAPGEPVLTDTQWITGELYRTTHALLLPTMLVLVGSLFFAIGVINLPGPQRLLRPGRTWRELGGQP
ncbi:MAG TPA: GDSL-type esterase/lipase family protein [Ilumatobacter sp.]|nr:GDSL-type esterase/lipase family protein [Ilumatobacter sp.]